RLVEEAVGPLHDGAEIHDVAVDDGLRGKRMEAEAGHLPPGLLLLDLHDLDGARPDVDAHQVLAFRRHLGGPHSSSPNTRMRSGSFSPSASRILRFVSIRHPYPFSIRSIVSTERFARRASSAFDIISSMRVLRRLFLWSGPFFGDGGALDWSLWSMGALR